MISADEAALICDLAEVYHIYDYKSLPLSKVAILSIGLRDNSRIKMKMNDVEYPFETILLAAALDRLSFLAWTKTVDSQKGINRPKSVIDEMIGVKNKEELIGYESGQDFMRAWKEINTERSEN